MQLIVFFHEHSRRKISYEIYYLDQRIYLLIPSKVVYQQFDFHDNKFVIVTHLFKQIFPLNKHTQELYVSGLLSIDKYIEELENISTHI